MVNYWNLFWVLAVATLFYGVHVGIDSVQPATVNKTVSFDVEQAAKEQNVTLLEIASWNPEDAWFGSGLERTQLTNASQFVTVAKDANVPIKSYEHVSEKKVMKYFGFKAGNAVYEYRADCYPSQESRNGYEIKSTANWPEVEFETNGFNVFVLNFIVGFILLVFLGLMWHDY